MKVYRVEGDKAYAAEVPDGATCMELNARSYDFDDEPISLIDFKAKRYRRGTDRNLYPFPERWFTNDQLVWKLHREGEKLAGQETP